MRKKIIKGREREREGEKDREREEKNVVEITVFC